MKMRVNVEKIRGWRDDRCWSQEHLAEVAGVSPRTIQRLENGDSVSRETVLALAAAFDVPASALAADVEAKARAAAELAAKRKGQDAWAAFWIHLATYVGVIALLVWINVASEPDRLWTLWPAIGLGIGVIGHGAALILADRYPAAPDDGR